MLITGLLNWFIQTVFYFSGNPYFRVIFSSDGLSINALNVSESDVGSGYAEHGDGIVYDLITLVSLKWR